MFCFGGPETTTCRTRCLNRQYAHFSDGCTRDCRDSPRRTATPAPRIARLVNRSARVQDHCCKVVARTACHLVTTPTSPTGLRTSRPSSGLSSYRAFHRDAMIRLHAGQCFRRASYQQDRPDQQPSRANEAGRVTPPQSDFCSVAGIVVSSDCHHLTRRFIRQAVTSCHCANTHGNTGQTPVKLI